MIEPRHRILTKGVLLLFVACGLSGCMQSIKSSRLFGGPPPPPKQDSWCYETLGYAECYSKPQDVPPERLINVDPASHYPPDAEGYRKALAGSR